MDLHRCRGLVVNAPEAFADPEFREWLADDAPKFTWYRSGDIDEWSDVVVLVDPGLTGEGSDTDMPAPVWDRIIDLCRMHLGPDQGQQSHYMVRLTNLAV